MTDYKPNPLPETEAIELGAQWRRLEELLDESDYVSLHHRFIEGPDGNDKQFSAEVFQRMKRADGLFH